MQLPTPFIRIPLDFDAERLAGEIAQFAPDDWRPHPQGHPGNWALPLVAVGGRSARRRRRRPDAPDAAPRTLPVPAAGRSPRSTSPLGRTRLMKLDARAEATPHVDINYYWQQRVRVHVPIVTFPEVEFLCGDASTRMAAGECWIFDTWRMHNVLNPTPLERIHLVADTVGSEAFWRMTEGEQTARAVPLRARRRTGAALREVEPSCGHVAVGDRQPVGELAGRRLRRSGRAGRHRRD